ncbi:hypothetical protein [Methylorubrum sp. SB2]|uniref:hypothetical protein n=1 Tax=Methylorubrum subtropicum TaxID=3138812 RepID=UPI00313CAFA5
MCFFRIAATAWVVRQGADGSVPPGAFELTERTRPDRDTGRNSGPSVIPTASNHSRSSATGRMNHPCGIACMWKLKQRDLVREVAIEGELKGWARAQDE